MYSAVAFGSPLLTSAEYADYLNTRRKYVSRGETKIPRRRKGESWRATVASRLSGARGFEDLVRNAIDALPERFRAGMENVEIVVEDSGRPGLLGYYQGVPLPERGSSYSGYLPDRITIYRRALEARATSPEDLAEQVRITVWHEIAHHFGIDEDRLHELGMG